MSYFQHEILYQVSRRIATAHVPGSQDSPFRYLSNLPTG